MTVITETQDARLVYRKFQEASILKREMVSTIKATPEDIIRKYGITRSLLNNFFSFGQINIILGDRDEIRQKCLESEIDLDMDILKHVWGKLGIDFVRFGFLEEINSSIAIFGVATD